MAFDKLLSMILCNSVVLNLIYISSSILLVKFREFEIAISSKKYNLEINILEKSKRLDLRKLDEVRTIKCET